MATVLVIGSGAREHAMAWKLSRSPHVSRLICAPGNDGMSSEWERWTEPHQESYDDLIQKAQAEKVDLVVVGPDNALADGVVDRFQRVGITCFGPTAAAAQIEASKSFAKEIMIAADVPTAKYVLARSLEEAEKAVRSFSGVCVVKADGLALGKGVQVCSNMNEALQACRDLFPLSQKLVIEEKLQGKEISWLAFCDGERCALFEPARDYKRVSDQDQGPNTGGMGVFSPVAGVPASWPQRMKEKIFLPVLREMKKRGAPFQGILYAGLMVDFQKDQFWVLEFNARFGDPETQVLLPRMTDDFYLWCKAVALGMIGGNIGNANQLGESVRFTSQCAVYVVGAARGYPEKPEKGKVIEGLNTPTSQTEAHRIEHFTAGVLRQGKDFVTSGGRVFGALGMGETQNAARQKAYERLAQVYFEGMHFRSDIAR